MAQLSEEVEDELTAVSSILLDAITIDRRCSSSPSGGVRVSVRLSPLTASDDDDLSYVEMVLSLTLDCGYPETPPTIEVQSPRGLSEEQVSAMISEMRERCASLPGCPVVFELVDYCRERLTERNVPSGRCPICLSALRRANFCKTSCFHHFHSFCLASYVDSLEGGEEEEVPCPVCREDVAPSLDVRRLREAKEPVLDDDEDDDGDWLLGIRRTQERMRAVFERQLRNGGIIDLEAESKRLLVTISTVDGPSTPQREEASSSSPRAEQGKEAAAAVEEKARKKGGKGNNYRRRRHGGDHQQHRRRRKNSG